MTPERFPQANSKKEIREITEILSYTIGGLLIILALGDQALGEDFSDTAKIRLVIIGIGSIINGLGQRMGKQ